MARRDINHLPVLDADGMLVDLLLRRMAGEQAPSATMPAELVVRESSAPPGGARRRP